MKMDFESLSNELLIDNIWIIRVSIGISILLTQKESDDSECFVKEKNVQCTS